MDMHHRNIDQSSSFTLLICFRSSDQVIVGYYVGSVSVLVFYDYAVAVVSRKYDYISGFRCIAIIDWMRNPRITVSVKPVFGMGICTAS